MAKKTTGICKAYKYRIYPNKEQQSYINQNIGGCKVLWNAMLTELREHNCKWHKLKEAGEDISNFKFDFSYKRFKEKYDWMNLCDSNALNKVGRNLKKAQMDKSKGKPKYKDTKAATGAYYMKAGTVSISEDSRWVTLPKMQTMSGKGAVRIIMHRDLPEEGRIISVTASRTATKEYYLSFTVELPEGQQPEFKTVSAKETGIDLGLADFLTLADGTKVDNPRFLQKSLSKLRRAQRKLSRMGYIAKLEGRSLRESRNYQKQRLVVAKLHQKVARQREYFLHTTSTQLVREHQFIAMETLDIKGMLKQRKLARQISDVSWFEFGRQLAYKAEWAGRTVIKIDKWFPSTQKCHCCGHISGKKPLSVRKWHCPECGEVHDRDGNAAINIYQEGKRIAAEAA